MSVHTERIARAQLIHLEIERLCSEARAHAVIGDIDRLEAARDEISVLLESLREIRRDQLREEIERSWPKPRRPWWRFWS